MPKITFGEVMKRHDEWARASGTWGVDNLATIRALGKYYDAKTKYKADHGKDFVPKIRRSR